MADTFQYGTVTLTHVKTESFEQRTEYDPSNTDALWTRTSLTVTGMLAYGLPPAAGGETAAETLKRIEHSLMQPRQYLRYQVGSKTVIEVGDKNTGKAVDVNKGPMPQSITTGVITEGSIEVRFSVVTCIITCPSLGNGSALRGFASNRWSQTESYDKAAYCTLQTSGIVICRTDLKQQPDQLREVIAPPIRQGYQRVNSRYTLTPDGTHLQYEIEDREFYLPPPFVTFQDSTNNNQTTSTQALEADGNMMVTTSHAGNKWMGVVTVRLRGQKNVPKSALLSRCLDIAQSMLKPWLLKNAVTNQIVTQDMKIDSALYENEVHVQIQGWLDPNVIRQALPGGTGKISLLSQTPAYSSFNNQPGVAPAIRGNGQFLALLGAVFQDPCINAAIAIDIDAPGELAQGDQILGEYVDPGFTINGGGLTGSTIDITQFGSNGGGGGGATNLGLQSINGGGTVGAGNQVSKPLANNYSSMRINPASIGIGPVSQSYSPPPDVAYDVWMMKLDYEYDTGAVVLPSTKDGQKSSYIRVRNGSLMMVVSWTAIRTGQPPDIPDPCPGDGTDVVSTNYKLIGKVDISTDEIEQGPTGALRYKISGCYRYGVLDPTIVPVINPLPPFLAKTILGSPVGQAVTPSPVAANVGVTDLAGTLAAGFIGLVVPFVPPAQNGGGGVLAGGVGGAAGGAIAAVNNAGRDIGNNGVFHLERTSIWYSLKTISPYKLFASC